MNFIGIDTAQWYLLHEFSSGSAFNWRKSIIYQITLYDILFRKSCKLVYLFVSYMRKILT